jgi:hypothetical protein
MILSHDNYMKKNYDFSKGIKNPYADRLKNGYTITVHYDFKKYNNETKETDNNIIKNKKRPQKQM